MVVHLLMAKSAGSDVSASKSIRARCRGCLRPAIGQFEAECRDKELGPCTGKLSSRALVDVGGRGKSCLIIHLHLSFSITIPLFLTPYII